MARSAAVSPLRIPQVPARGRRLATLVFTSLAIFAIALFLDSYRHQLTPDIHVDELIYANASQNLALGHGLSVQGQPFFWQAPLVFVIEWPIVALSHIGGWPTIDLALQLRILSGAAGALTAMLLFLWGRRLGGLWLGGSIVALFLADPFVERVLRRHYLEPFAGVWVVAFLWVCSSSAGRWTWRRRLFAGLLLGLSLLTKELTVYAFGILVVMALRRLARLRDLVSVGAVAAAVYAPYPIWALAQGLGSGFFDLKLYQYDRLIGLLHTSGLNRPGVSLTQTLAATAADYWPSYLLIAAAAPATAWLWFRRDRDRRFLGIWSAASYLLIAFLGAFGTLNEQFFYYLMIPVVVVDALMFVQALGYAARRARAPRARRALRLLRVDSVLALALVAVLFLRPDERLWQLRFGTEVDNGFPTVIEQIEKQVPSGQLIDLPGASLEILHFAFPNGEYKLAFDQSLPALATKNVHWLVMSSKDIEQRRLDPAFYNDVRAASQERWGTDEHTFFHLALYQLAYPQVFQADAGTPGHPGVSSTPR